MSLQTGATLGPYEIAGLLGKGGMGEVYRARDTRLDRTVALKTLHAELSGHAEFRERFVREARAISALNHAHICTLYDVGQQDQLSYLVMEYVAGDSLAERLRKGPLAPAEAVACAAQVADALDHAHRRGVVHRDLKPSNILLTKAGAKLLDFGIAKLLQPSDAVVEAPPEAATVTMQGMVVGTLHYMAPEQLQGQEVDGRADLFSLGAVIYEMLTGARAFDGGSQATIMAKIISGEPDRLTELAAIGPPELDRAVRRCLAKDADDRWQTARDLRAELKWVGERLTQTRSGAYAIPTARQEAAAVTGSPIRKWLPWMVAAAALALAAISVPWAATRGGADSPDRVPLVQFAVTAPGDATLELDDEIGGSAISPDGKRLAMVVTRGGKPMLALRELDSLEVKVIEGSEGAAYPFWSPDARWIGFFAGQKLKKAAASGGLPQALCDAPEPHGGTWGANGVIVLAPSGSGPLHRAGDSGGSSEPLTRLNAAGKEIAHSWPHLLPDGDTVLFLARTAQRHANQLHAARLASPATTVKVVDTNFRGGYNRDGRGALGHLLFVRDGTLLAQPFDTGRLALRGEPTPLAFGIASRVESGYAGFSAADGVLVHRVGADRGRRLRTLSRSGAVLSEAAEPDHYISLREAPDRANLVVTRMDSETGLVDLWLVDPQRRLRTRLTFDDGLDTSPVWAPGGGEIVFASSPGGTLNLHRLKLDGASRPVLVAKSPNPARPTDWSRDGRWIVYEEEHPQTRRDLWIMPADGQGAAKLLARTPFNEFQGQLSPDGKWLAYTSDDSGRPEVVLRGVEEAGAPYRVSASGGTQPRWRADGRELYYVSADGKLTAVAVTAASGQVKTGAPEALFGLAAPGAGVTDFRYDAGPKGERFVAIVQEASASREVLAVTVNWRRKLR